MYKLGPGGGEEDKKVRKIFEEIMVKNFPHVVILTGTSKKYHKPQIG